MKAVDRETGQVIVLMDVAEAQTITAEIKAYSSTLWLKLEEAQRGQAWRALGYPSWEAYLDEEFDISRSRGYQLVSHARAVRALADAAGVPVSTMVDTPERATRGLDVESAAEEIASAVTEESTTEERVKTTKTVIRTQAETEEQRRERLIAACIQAIADDPEADNLTIAERVGCSVVKVRAARQKISQTAGAGAGPAPSPADAGCPPAPAPSAPAEDEEPDEAMPAGSETESTGEASSPSPVDPYPELTFAVNASKAAARIYEDTAVLDPGRLASDAAEDRADWLALADHLTAKADAIRAAFVRPHLEAVR
jgi:hypothetical protein